MGCQKNTAINNMDGASQHDNIHKLLNNLNAAASNFLSHLHACLVGAERIGLSLETYTAPSAQKNF